MEWRRFAVEPTPFDYETVSDDDLTETIRSISNQYAEFEEFFSVFGIKYYSVIYEDLMADTPIKLKRLLTNLGVSVANPAALISRARTSVIQRDEASDRRLQKFHFAMNSL